MDGYEYQAAEFVLNLRLSLFKEHFGLDPEECFDPLNEKMWESILQRTSVPFSYEIYFIINREIQKFSKKSSDAIQMMKSKLLMK